MEYGHDPKTCVHCTDSTTLPMSTTEFTVGEKTFTASDILRVVAEMEEEATELRDKYGESYYQGYINTLESIRGKLNLPQEGGEK